MKRDKNRRYYSSVRFYDVYEMFTTCGITKCQVSEFLKEVWPFILCLVAVLVLLTFCPILITFVPDLIYG